MAIRHESEGVLIGVTPDDLTNEQATAMEGFFSPLRPWEYAQPSKFFIRELQKEGEIQQMAVDLFRKVVKKQHPNAMMIVDVLRSVKLPNERIMAKAKRAGLEKFQPDMIFVHKAHGFNGLALELKKWTVNRGKKGNLSSISNPVFNVKTGMIRPKIVKVYKTIGGKKTVVGEYDHNLEQWKGILSYRENGFCADFCVGLESLRKTLEWYFNIKY